jgi:hypothetical protein
MGIYVRSTIRNLVLSAIVEFVVIEIIDVLTAQWIDLRLDLTVFDCIRRDKAW